MKKETILTIVVCVLVVVSAVALVPLAYAMGQADPPSVTVVLEDWEMENAGIPDLDPGDTFIIRYDGNRCWTFMVINDNRTGDSSEFYTSSYSFCK